MMTTTEPTFALSAAEFDLVTGALGLGRPQFPLQVPSQGRTMEERADLTAEAFRALADRGLAQGDQLDEQLAAMLRLLVDHDTAIDVVGYVGQPLQALAAVTRRSGVLAQLTGDQLLLTEIRPTALALSAVSVLPPAEAGTKRALSLREEQLSKAVAEDDDDPFGGDYDDETALVRAGLPPQDAAVLAELVEARTGGGQFGVTHRSVRASTLVTWFDTNEGRYLMVSDRGWLSIAPADDRRLEHRLAEVLAGLE
ncbi:ESX secretion-associated protein EspG [Saccharopolyspora hordei]